MISEVRTLALGFRALQQLNDHADQEDRCRDCARYAVALMRGAGTADALHLRCDEAQVWQQRVVEAHIIAQAVLKDAE